MKYLADINVLLAVIWEEHPNHKRAFDWLAGKKVVVCPLTELGFLRISTNHKAPFNAPMDKARELLTSFINERQASRIADDVPALESHPIKSDQVTDVYLAELAVRHELKLATLDGGINHPAAVLIS